MKKTISFTLCLVALAQSSLADTFIMKDGSKIVGSILRQDATSYVLQVQFTKSIKEEKTIAKADVEKIQREQLDLTAFVEIEKLIPAPDILTAKDYAAKIKKVEKFLVDYPGTSKAKEAKAILATLKTEANAILAGGIKLSGMIIPSEEYRDNVYEIDARIQEEKIRSFVKSGQFSPALRTFTTFSQDFRNTSACTAVLPLISQVMSSYQQEIEALIASYSARSKERKTGLKRMSGTDRAITEMAIKEEREQNELLLAREKEANIGWVTIHPYYKASLDEALSFCTESITLLGTMKATPQVDGGKLFRDALSLIQLEEEENANAVTAAIEAAKNAEIAPRYITLLEEAAKAKGSKE